MTSDYQPSLSILMGVHNGALTVRRAIESACDQEFRDWELVVVDDGSTDQTAQLLYECARRDPRIIVLQNANNQGLAASLNHAARVSKAELVGRMDADDVNLPGRFGRQVDFLRSNLDVSILGTAVVLESGEGRDIGNAYRPERHEELVEKLYKENPFVHSTIVMRRHVLSELGGYDERLRRSQDYDLWLRAYRRYRFHNLREVLVRHRVRRRLPLNLLFWGAFVLARGAHRDGRLFPNCVYALRFLAAGMLNNLGIREARLK